MAPPPTSKLLLGGRFASGTRIGAGAFGEVFLGTDREARVQVAIKVEPSSAKHGCLEREVQAYRALSQSERVPRILWQGMDSLGQRAIVIDLLGPSLAGLLAFCGDRFSLKTTLALVRQMLDCLEAVHSVGLVHRDLKPENFLIGLGAKASTVHIIDFGLSTAWIDGRTRLHVPFRENRGLGHIGTARYSSIGSHSGMQQSRRDDVESLGYLMLYFLNGSLPWQHVHMFCQNAKEHHLEVAALKSRLSVDRLCRRHPAEIATYLRYARSLCFDECPDYTFMKNVLRDLFEERGYEDDSIFDWTIVAQGLTLGTERKGPCDGKDLSAASTRASQQGVSGEVEA